MALNFKNEVQAKDRDLRVNSIKMIGSWKKTGSSRKVK